MNEQAGRGKWVVFTTCLAILAVSIVTLLMMSNSRARNLASHAQLLQKQSEAGPLVEIATAEAGPDHEDITLLGEAIPYNSATLYAQVSGYLKSIQVDKGDHVRAGQHLAEIISPKVDYQYQAALANLENARATLDRQVHLVQIHAASEQAVDDARAQARVAQATVEQLRVLKSYEVLTAPFDGTITARYADPGALVQDASNSQTSALPVVTITENDRLRMRVYVDQAHAGRVHPGTAAQVYDPARPEVRTPAQVSRTAQLLDPQTRTMLTEIDIDNRAGHIVAGSFVNVDLRLPEEVRHPTVPAGALILRGQDTLVAIVDAGNHVHLQPVKVATADGQTAQIASGLEVGERVAVNTGDTLSEGGRVRPAPVAQPGQQH